ncbi:serine/threonine-protein kinase [Streptomyces sp. NBC_00582]|uniref:serine/threonine-protein kinase n=1 Tax=Streptomyces sp. NBC_00582 TaxID=2975783 RepID=UPI001062E3AF|nr:serine/threonine-protein kinase [Streptomyces sp. NBC_00582]WUB65003.1 serine/threonine protein kinase [Streptomyces sp. NBC_00582]
MGGVQPGGQFRPLENGDPAEVAGYRLAARLGSGGMGTVYLSYTPGGHPIALKTIRPELSEDAEFRRRFRQEVQAAQRVQGLHTAPVLDYDTEGDRPWLATAYVPGPSLASAVAEHGPLPVPSLLLLLAGTAEALSVIHGAGIVHRDLKPSNVLLAADGPRVIDFGIARAADATALTGTGVSLGTPAFMSPEQAAGKEVTPASDVFALGQVAAYAARGTGAYGDGPSHAVLYRIVHEEPDLTGLPAELGFVARCLAKDPADRPSPAALVKLCQDASPTPLRQSGSWLPEAISAQITQRISASERLAAPPAPTAPLTRVDRPQQHAAPTVAVPPAPPQAPPQPVTPAYGHPMAPPAHPSPYAQPGPYPAPPAGPYLQPRPAWQPPRRPSGTRRALGIIAGVLLPLAGCTGLLYAVGTTGSSSSSGSDTTGSASAKPLPDPEPVRFTSINIPDGYYIEFADSPPKPQDDDVEIYESDLYYYDDALHSAGDRIVLLNNAQKGSLKTCRDETRYADSVSLSQLSKGSQLCVHTDSGHIALVTFRGTAAESDPSDYVSLDLTIWRNAEEASDS